MIVDSFYFGNDVYNSTEDESQLVLIDWLIPREDEIEKLAKYLQLVRNVNNFAWKVRMETVNA